MKQVKGVDTKGYCLYELTERDLAYLVDHSYDAGNILIFSPNTKAKLGREIGRANNLNAAEQYLASLSAEQHLASIPVEQHLTSISERSKVPPTSPTQEKDGALPELVSRYEKLHREEIGQYEVRIEGLIRENEELQRSIAEKTKRVEELSFLTLQNDIEREEMLSDLKEISSSSAIKALEEIDDLRIRVVELETQLSFERNKCANLDSAAVLLSAENSILENEVKEAYRLLEASRKADAFTTESKNDKELVLTNSSGGVIHIYHEFPPIPRQSIRKRLFSQARHVAIVITGILLIAYIFYLSSLVASIEASGIDVSSYSHALLEKIRSLFGF